MNCYLRNNPAARPGPAQGMRKKVRACHFCAAQKVHILCTLNITPYYDLGRQRDGHVGTQHGLCLELPVCIHGQVLVARDPGLRQRYRDHQAQAAAAESDVRLESVPV